MLRYYASSEGIVESTEQFVKGGLVTLVDPSEQEVSGICEEFHIDPAKILAALDVEEPSRYERDGTGFYLYLDVPYVDSSGNYNTVPLLTIHQESAIIAVCKKPVGIIDRFLHATVRPLDLNKNADFQMHLLQVITKLYQQALKEIDSKRRTIDSGIRESRRLTNEDIGLLHDLENSLVYLTTSLNAIDSLLYLMKTEGGIELKSDIRVVYKTVRIEIQQAIEMASVYRQIMGSTRDLISMEINLRLNLIMRKLAILTIILTLPMVITGAYGMNVDLPLQDQSWAFGLICLVTVFILVCVTLILRRQHI